MRGVPLVWTYQSGAMRIEGDDVVVCEPDRVRVGLFRVVFVLTRVVDGG